MRAAEGCTSRPQRQRWCIAGCEPSNAEASHVWRVLVIPGPQASPHKRAEAFCSILVFPCGPGVRSLPLSAGLSRSPEQDQVAFDFSRFACREDSVARPALIRIHDGNLPVSLPDFTNDDDCGHLSCLALVPSTPPDSAPPPRVSTPCTARTHRPRRDSDRTRPAAGRGRTRGTASSPPSRARSLPSWLSPHPRRRDLLRLAHRSRLKHPR